MLLYIGGALIIVSILWLTELTACKCTKIDDTSEVDNAELDHVPTKTDIEKHNVKVGQQWATKQQKAQQHISSILDKAYKDYVNNKIKENGYIYQRFTLLKGEYGITYSEILAISRPFTYSIYNVECAYSDIFHEYIINVTVDHQRKEDWTWTIKRCFTLNVKRL